MAHIFYLVDRIECSLHYPTTSQIKLGKFFISNYSVQNITPNYFFLESAPKCVYFCITRKHQNDDYRNENENRTPANLQQTKEEINQGQRGGRANWCYSYVSVLFYLTNQSWHMPVYSRKSWWIHGSGTENFSSTCILIWSVISSHMHMTSKFTNQIQLIKWTVNQPHLAIPKYRTEGAMGEDKIHMAHC